MAQLNLKKNISLYKTQDGPITLQNLNTQPLSM